MSALTEHTQWVSKRLDANLQRELKLIAEHHEERSALRVQRLELRHRIAQLQVGLIVVALVASVLGFAAGWCVAKAPGVSDQNADSAGESRIRNLTPAPIPGGQ